MGFGSSFKKALGKVASVATGGLSSKSSLGKIASAVAGASSIKKIAQPAIGIAKKVTVTPVKKIGRAAKPMISGSLDPKKALGLGLLNTQAAAWKYPRESLIAGGVVATGAYAAQAAASAGVTKTAVAQKVLKKVRDRKMSAFNQGAHDAAAVPLQPAPAETSSSLITPAVIISGLSLVAAVVL